MNQTPICLSPNLRTFPGHPNQQMMLTTGGKTLAFEVGPSVVTIRACRPSASCSNTGNVSRFLHGALPGGRETPPDQDDLHEVLRTERHTGNALPEVREQGAPAEGEGSAEGVARAG